MDATTDPIVHLQILPKSMTARVVDTISITSSYVKSNVEHPVIESDLRSRCIPHSMIIPCGKSIRSIDTMI